MIDYKRKLNKMDNEKWKVIIFIKDELDYDKREIRFGRTRLRYPRCFIQIFDKLNQLKRL